MDTVVQAAWIQAMGSIVASIVAAGVATWIGKRWLSQRRLEEELKVAREDIVFLLQVEKHYIEHARIVDEIPGKNTVRADVNLEGYSWSGKNTKSRHL